MRVLNQAFDASLNTEEHAAAPLAGGIMQYGYQCGMIWGRRWPPEHTSP